MTAALAVLAIVGLLQTQTVLRVDRGPPFDQQELDIMKFVSEQAGDHAPALVIGARDAAPAPPVLDWNLVRDGVLTVTAAGSAVDPPLERRLGRALNHLPIPSGLRANAQDALDRYNEPATARSLYARDNQSRFEIAFESTLASDPPNAIIAAISTSDTTSHRIDFVDPTILRAGFQRTAVREFSRLETRVVVYRRP